MLEAHGWIGVDLDGTLAVENEWLGPHHIGEPVPAMVERVRAWLAQGKEVRIVTARVAPQPGFDHVLSSERVRAWCRLHLGADLPVTYCKDHEMLQLWDDRAVQVIRNTGERADGKI